MKVDGVTLEDVFRQIKSAAPHVLPKKVQYEVTLDKKEKEVRVEIQSAGLCLWWQIDGDLIPGQPYWWWQIDQNEFPQNFGKAQMHGLYKLTIRDRLYELGAYL